MNKPRLKRIISTTIAVLAVGVTVYLVLLSAKLVRGVSATAPAPANAVRLQVVTVDDGSGSAAQIAQRVAKLEDDGLAIDVVEADHYDLRSISRTMIISRVEDKTAAERLAARLGLDPSGVTYRPLEHNRRQVTATLVAGPDFDSVMTALETAKELQRQS